MKPWKRVGLSAYYATTLPLRKVMLRRAADAGKSPIAVLFYHRVADGPHNDWTIARRTFARHLDWLREHCDLVSLADAQRLVREGNRGRIAVSITFDDGYAENCDFALPLLLDREIPFTYFTCLDYIQRGVPFPHDVASEQYLRPNTPAQIIELAALGAEIGAHTRTHPNLGCVDEPDRLYDEIVTARDELEQLIGKSVRYFAFPYGLHANLSLPAARLAHEHGYAAVCSAYGAYNIPGQSAFHLRRIHGDPEMLRFTNWLSGDPRRLIAGDTAGDFEWDVPDETTHVGDSAVMGVSGR
ncbi:MAG: polysaccharide deacetylase family protein [Planctomycetales bacterium]|nr:polysaccharide deacetylase family protein [Planctomycetales bacterium]